MANPGAPDGPPGAGDDLPAYFGRRFRDLDRGQRRSWTVADQIMVKNLIGDLDRQRARAEVAERALRAADEVYGDYCVLVMLEHGREHGRERVLGECQYGVCVRRFQILSAYRDPLAAGTTPSAGAEGVVRPGEGESDDR